MGLKPARGALDKHPESLNVSGVGKDQSREVVAEAARLRQAGRTAESRALLERLLATEPTDAGALNALGLLALQEGRAAEAVAHFRRAVTADPAGLGLWINLADAQRRVSDATGALISLDQALAIDPYALPAVLAKAQIFAEIGQTNESARMYRVLFAATPDWSNLPPNTRAALEAGKAIVDEDDRRRSDLMAAPAQAVFTAYPREDRTRARAYLESVAGRRKIFVQNPTGPFFPYLPAFEFFDRSHFPWFAELEAATDTIRAEYLALAGRDGFDPYIQYAPGTPVNQWAELNHNVDWSALFLWKDGARQDANCDRCPRTAALVEALPLMEVDNRAPTAMFSVLQPHTRIPPHTGVTNARVVVHLPLIVPGDCGFRVGGETRQWREGQAWAFDDTIEHEAWNNSDLPRVVLIVDAWNPLLTDMERAIVREVGKVS